jgi:hypothetical protein
MPAATIMRIVSCRGALVDALREALRALVHHQGRQRVELGDGRGEGCLERPAELLGIAPACTALEAQHRLPISLDVVTPELAELREQLPFLRQRDHPLIRAQVALDGIGGRRGVLRERRTDAAFGDLQLPGREPAVLVNGAFDLAEDLEARQPALADRRRRLVGALELDDAEQPDARIRPKARPSTIESLALRLDLPSHARACPAGPAAGP